MAFDTETTGLSAASCHITEIGAVKFDVRGIVARFATLVDPGEPIPHEITALTGITDRMVRGKPTAHAAASDFMRFCGGAPLVAHNAGFDISFISAALADAGEPPPANTVLDTKALAVEAFPGLKSYALQNLAAEFGIQVLAAHRAEDDARVCMELFIRCLARLAMGAGLGRTDCR